MRVALSIVLLAVLLQLAAAEYCNGKPAPGERINSNPLIDANPQFAAQVANGKLFWAGPSDHRFPVVHVWGSPYEMGFAQGQLLKDRVNQFVNLTYTYLITQAVDSWPSDFFSPQIKALIVEIGMDAALDWNVGVTAPFTPQSFLDEVRGVADGSGVDYKMLLRLNYFPELSKASCSFVGAWGTATAAGKVLQVRALDFDMDGPFRDFHQLTVYHPSSGKNGVASLNWAGFVGVLTGMSDQQMAVSEIGVSFPDDSFGQGTPDTPSELVAGKPWMFVLRDALQMTNSLGGALADINQSNRTCNLIIGVGDGKAGAVSGIEYGGRVFKPYRDTNLLPVNDTWHPQIPNVVYNGMDWLCPGYTSKLGGQLQKYHGSLDAATLIRNVLITVQTGDLHAAVYDLSANLMHVSLARNSTDPTTQPRNAYERQFSTFDMTKLFAEPAPQQ